MGQRQQHLLSGTDDSAWLNTLIDGFERTEKLMCVPCDTKTQAAAMARLSRPASRIVTKSRRQSVLEFHH
jgi:hypothetical protein